MDKKACLTNQQEIRTECTTTAQNHYDTMNKGKRQPWEQKLAPYQQTYI